MRRFKIRWIGVGGIPTLLQTTRSKTGNILDRSPVRLRGRFSDGFKYG